MSIFGGLLPDSDGLFDIEAEALEEISLITDYQATLGFTFGGPTTETGYLSGTTAAVALNTGQTALMSWIEKAIRTPRGVYAIYDDDYGTALARGIGAMTFEELRANVAGDLSRCLALHPLIEEVSNVTIVKNGVDGVILSFEIADRVSGQTQVQADIEGVL